TRKSLTKETLGVDVIAIGVPTVVDAATLTIDVLDMAIDNLIAITKRTLENMLDNFSDNIPNIIYAIIVFVIGIYISKIVRRMVS
ncbi:GPR endopeptidase, partial [Clostridioides difficile]